MFLHINIAIKRYVQLVPIMGRPLVQWPKTQPNNVYIVVSETETTTLRILT